MAKRIIIKKVSTKDLSEGALAFTTGLLGAFRLDQVLIHFAAAVTETVSVTQDAVEGANYDTLLDTSTLSAAQNYVFRPTGNAIFAAGDQIKVACTAATATCIAYVQVIVEDLGK